MTDTNRQRQGEAGSAAGIRQQLWRRRRNRMLLGGGFVVLLVVLSLVMSWHEGQSSERKSGDDYQDYHDKSFECVRVVDGDTIDVAAYDPHGPAGRRKYTRIRMWGMDTPELPGRGHDEMYFSRQATAFAEDLMQDKTVRLELVEGYTRGYYGRLLAYVYLPDGTLYNRLAIEQGYAYADHRFVHPKRQEFLELERQARNQRRGLWQAVTVDDLPRWYRKGKLKGFFTSVTTIPATAPAN